VCAAVCCSVLQCVAVCCSVLPTAGVESASTKLQYTKSLFSVSSDFSRVGISGDNPSFGIHKREKTHAVLRLANFVSPFLHTWSVPCVAKCCSVSMLLFTDFFWCVKQCVAVCCSVVVCCGVLQCAMCRKMLQCVNAAFHGFLFVCVAVCCSVLQYAMCSKMLQCVNAAFHRFLFIDYRGHILCSHISSVVLIICFFCRISSLL